MLDRSQARYLTGVPLLVDADGQGEQVQKLSFGITGCHEGNEAICIDIFNEDDFSFLHCLELTRTEFRKLKEQQNLIIDFSKFPCRLLELLGKCVEWSTEDIPKFQAALTIKGMKSTFQIIHNGDFKRFPTLELSLMQPVEGEVKQFLAARLAKVLAELNDSKEETRELRKQLGSFGKGQQRLAQATGTKTGRTDMESQLRLQLELVTEAKDALDSENKENMTKLKDRLADAESQLTLIRDESAKEKYKLEEQVNEYKAQVNSLLEQIDILKDSNKQLSSQCKDSEDSSAAKERHCKTLEAENEKNAEIVQRLVADLQEARSRTQRKHAQLETMKEQCRQHMRAEAEERRKVEELEAELEREREKERERENMRDSLRNRQDNIIQPQNPSTRTRSAESENPYPVGSNDMLKNLELIRSSSPGSRQYHGDMQGPHSYSGRHSNNLDLENRYKDLRPDLGPVSGVQSQLGRAPIGSNGTNLGNAYGQRSSHSSQGNSGRNYHRLNYP